MNITLDKHHIYWVDGIRVPGVNEILNCVGTRKFNPHLVPDGVDPHTLWESVSGIEWFKDENAAEFGTILHDTIRMRLRGTLGDYDPQLQPWLDAQEKFTRRHRFHSEGAEWPLYSRLYGYAGTPDWVVRHNGTLVVIDWKAWDSKATGPLPRLQVAAYGQLVKASLGGRTPRGCVVMLHSDGTHDEHWFASGEMDREFNKFLSVLNVYRMMEKTTNELLDMEH